MLGLEEEDLQPDIEDYSLSLCRGASGSDVIEALNRALGEYSKGERTRFLQVYSGERQNDGKCSEESGVIVELNGNGSSDCIYARLDANDMYSSLQIKSSLRRDELKEINGHVNEALRELSEEGPLYDSC